MKLLCAVLVTVFCLGAQAVDRVPDGVYKGTGQWNDSKGGSGNFHLTFKMDGLTYTQKAVRDDGVKIEGKWSFVFFPHDDHRYAITQNKIPVGHGTCVEPQCTTSLVYFGYKFENQILYQNDHIFWLSRAVGPAGDITYHRVKAMKQ